MNRLALLQAWSRRAHSDLGWRAIVDETTDPERIAQAVAATLASPSEPEQTLRALMASGELEAAELLLLEPEGRDLDESEVQAAIRAARAEVVPRIEDLEIRAEAVGQAFDRAPILNATGKSRRQAEALLAEAEQRIRAAELAHATEAEASLVEPNPTWPWSGRAVQDILSWFSGAGAYPLGFEAYRPRPGDTDAHAFLQALQAHREGPTSHTREPLLRALASLLACQVRGFITAAEATVALLDGLDEPGLPVFSRHRWPAGIGLVLAVNDLVERLPEGVPGLTIRFTSSDQAEEGGGLVLRPADLWPVMKRSEGRRHHLLRVLGRQVPLEQAFVPIHPDPPTTNVWLPELGARPTLLVGAPGIGKSTVLEVFHRAGGQRVRANVDELPEAETLLIDGADTLEPGDLRSLVREIYWATTTREPPPRVLMAVRPDARDAVERLAPDRFEVRVLDPVPTTELAKQVRASMDMLGVRLEGREVAHHLAWLASGNPTVLTLLCDATVRLLRNRDSAITVPLVSAAWSQASFDGRVWALFEAPLVQCRPVLELIATYGDPKLPISDLEWLAQEKAVKDWRRDLQRLVDHGLVQQDEEAARLAPGGLGLQISRWLRAHKVEGAQSALR